MSCLRRYGAGMLDIGLAVKTVLTLSLFTVVAVSALGYVLIGPAPLYDANTMWITLALCGFLLAALIKGDEALFPMFVLLIVFLLLFVFVRILSFLYFPERVSLPLSVVLSAQQVNFGYAYIAIGTVALCAGFVLGRSTFYKLMSKGRTVSTSIKVYPLGHLIVVFTAVCAVQVYIALWLGSNVMSNMYYGVENKFVGVLSVLFSSMQAFVVVVVSMLAARKQAGVGVKILLLFIAAFLLVTVMMGSRAGGVLIYQAVLMAMLVLYGNFQERPMSYFLFLFLIALASMASFPVATEIRAAMLAERDSMVAPSNIRASSVMKTDDEDAWKISMAPVSVPASAGGMLNRLGAGFDTAVLTLTLDADQEMWSRTMNLPYALKSAVNVIVPGEVFADASNNTALLWPFIYKLRDSKLLQKGYYESFIWTPWGQAYSMFGWGAGLIALSVAGLILQVIYMGIAGNISSWQPYFSTWFLLNVFSFYSMMGLDDWLIGLQRTLFSLILVLLMLWGLERLVRLRIFVRVGDGG